MGTVVRPQGRLCKLLMLFMLIPSIQPLLLNRRRSKTSCQRVFGVRVWIEEAEDGFVDHDENLEDGEICLRSVKAFAQGSDEEEKRLLCAGALVRRPIKKHDEVAAGDGDDSTICDAWTADSLLDEANIQIRGAIQILDDLFLYHLAANGGNTVDALRRFVVRCGSLESEYTCSSHMASTLRGFRSLRDMTEIDSIYTDVFYDDLDGNVFDPVLGRARYEEEFQSNPSEIVQQILKFLPNEFVIKDNLILKEETEID